MLYANLLKNFFVKNRFEGKTKISDDVICIFKPNPENTNDKQLTFDLKTIISKVLKRCRTHDFIKWQKFFQPQTFVLWSPCPHTLKPILFIWFYTSEQVIGCSEFYMDSTKQLRVILVFCGPNRVGRIFDSFVTGVNFLFCGC